MLPRDFDFQGRIGRMTYFLNMLVVWVLSTVLIGVLAVALICLFQVAPSTAIVLGIIALLAYLWASLHFGFSQAAKRAHDLGHSGWISLLCLVPFLGFLVTLYFYFAPGDEHANLYGERDSG